MATTEPIAKNTSPFLSIFHRKKRVNGAKSSDDIKAAAGPPREQLNSIVSIACSAEVPKPDEHDNGSAIGRPHFGAGRIRKLNWEYLLNKANSIYKMSWGL
ncbi:unnamed protein product [Haemonchus placei]|uniref:PEST proteolytic signal-containing nuclear protein n=1 Tax=Haemonchus placei TaxID=6290 RepID=A0A0N4X9U9_HAEPC|nr:unnamed protein product [Haemonchus placei]